MTRRNKARLLGIAVLIVVLAIVLNPNCNIDHYNVRVVDKQVKHLPDGRKMPFKVKLIEPEFDAAILEIVQPKKDALPLDLMAQHVAIAAGRLHRGFHGNSGCAELAK